MSAVDLVSRLLPACMMLALLLLVGMLASRASDLGSYRGRTMNKSSAKYKLWMSRYGKAAGGGRFRDPRVTVLSDAEAPRAKFKQGRKQRPVARVEEKGTAFEVVASAGDAADSGVRRLPRVVSVGAG
ncbi:unnamed protein product [Polarella glacialis]|uniref:Uncharacterized protein n=1 Tax=Polarella glacialis TaxID=89957 RepID=A0A813G5M6_POLGL|nr:unnamed protein product [Polarella glacialis]|mmetsp:Transcript_86856/g.156444  ORF Transcript_86856/g.156444 Transcript_86856/m.156444 type:complete len:128 (-) Transcript_86856:29-412(-)